MMSNSTTIFGAIIAHDVEGVTQLITKNPELMKVRYAGEPKSLGSWGKTPLIMAALLGHVDIVKLLLEHGADVHQVTLGCCDADALYWAIAEGSASYGVIALLLQAGANPNTRNSCMNISALAEAARRSDMDLVQLLVEHGACVNDDGPGGGGTTSLMTAAEAGHIDIVKWLLEHGADPLITDLMGDTARTKALSTGHSAIAALLLEKESRTSGSSHSQ